VNAAPGSQVGSDTSNSQGIGMKRFPIDAYYRKSTVLPLGCHEAGHYVVARVLGFKAGSVKLQMVDMNGGHIGGSGSEPARALYGVKDILEYLEARVQVAYAGALAQSLSNGKVDEKVALNTLDEGGGLTDSAKARELIHLIRNIRYPAANGEAEIQLGLDEIKDDLWRRAIALIEKDHELIFGLGDRLSSELKFTGQEAELSEAELESMRSIQERFPKPEESKA